MALHYFDSMTTSLWEKIEAVRGEPEHVRMRYVVGCVSVSMVFIIGIWLLSVSENVSTTVSDFPQAMEQGKNITGGAPSLNDLFEQSAPLRIEGKSTEGGEFFDQQLNNRENTGTQSEGVTPQN